MARSRERGRFIRRSLEIIEKVGNALPHPATIFGLMAVAAILFSGLGALLNWSAVHPGTGETIVPVNLVSIEGLHHILQDMVVNFTSFAPLGTVLVAMLGIGISEGSGLIGSGLRLMVITAPRHLLTFVIVLAGVFSNAASEIGYVLLVPLGAIIFLAVGRHPIAGLAAAFAGVSGGYSANLVLGTIDPLLAGLSQEAAQILIPGYQVNAACNWYFMAASTFLIAGAGTWVTERIVAPRLGEYTGDEKPEELRDLTPEELRGLRYALFTLIAITLVLLAGTVPAGGFLRNPETGSLLHSPFLEGIVALIFIIFGLCGVAYGIGAGTYRNDKDVMKGMSKAMETLALYMVLVFFASQFVAFFRMSNLGLIFAVKGAEVLAALNLPTILLMVTFVVMSGFVNLFMGSASAKWAIMAPVFIPMLILLNISPEFTQVAYRIGDSTTNIIAPMMSYFALIVAFVERYDEKAGIGTVIATMLPYTIAFLIIWTILLIVWMALGIPVGPGATLYLPEGILAGVTGGM